jgi:hypothetical protein
MKNTWSMKMTFIRFLVLSVFMLATACMASSTDNVWHGEYSYSASGGQTAGGSQIMLEITLKIEPQGTKEVCELTLEGYQKDETILCTTAIDNSRLALQFKSYADGRVVNKYDVAKYKVGETLFSLENIATKNEKKQNRYLAYWGAYTPFGIERKNAKDYFEKIK